MKPILSTTTTRCIARVGTRLSIPYVIACCAHGFTRTIQPHITANIVNHRRFFSNSYKLMKDEKALKNLALNLQKGTLTTDQKKKEKTNKEGEETASASVTEQEQDQQQQSTSQQTEKVSEETEGQAQAQTQAQAQAQENSEVVQQSTAGQSDTTSPISQPITKPTNKPTSHPQQQTKARRNIPGAETPRDKLTRQLLFDAYDSVSMLTYDDLRFQQLFNPDGQTPKHYLDRHALLKSIPDKININETEDMKRIWEIYGKLAQLDDDKGMHEKHYRYLLGHLTELQRIRQQYNRIDRKFKRLRKGTVAQTSLSSSAFAADRSIPEVPYNVLGFDRSFSGMPLNTGVEESVFPQEFIEDLANVNADGTITLHKNDWDFIEPDDRVTRVDPRSVRSANDMIQRNNGSYSPTPTTTTPDFEDDIDEGNYIYISSLKNYRTLDFAFDETKRIKREILSIQTSLINEFQEKLRKKFPTGFYMGLDHQQCKPNQYSLIDSKTDAKMEIPMIPLYAKFANTPRRELRLYAHLFKLFLINVDEHLQNVIAISEFKDYQLKRFISQQMRNIRLAVKFRCDLKSMRMKFKRKIDAVVFKPYIDRDYTRIYWLRSPKVTTTSRISNRKRALRVKWTNVEDILKKKKPMTKHHQHQDQPHHFHHQ